MTSLGESACRSTRVSGSVPPRGAAAEEASAPAPVSTAPTPADPSPGGEPPPAPATPDSAPATCAARVQDACTCPTAKECGARLEAWLKPLLEACAKIEWDCGFADLAFDPAGCALALPERKKARFGACLQRALDERRWPCLAGASPRIFLGSCTLM
jgi:hypothetical protein